MKAFIRKLFGRATPSHRPSVKPRLEELENRLVPSTVAAAPYGGEYAVWGSDRGLYYYNPSRDPSWGGWSSEITNHVSQVAVGADGAVDVVHTDYSIERMYWVNAGWAAGWSKDSIPTPGSATINAIAAGPNGEVYMSWGTASKALWVYDRTGLHSLNDYGAVDLSVGSYGQLYKVYDNGSLHVADGMDQNDSVVWGWGVHHVAGGANGWVYFTFGSSNTLYGNNNGRWWDGPSNVAQISAGIDGGIDYVDFSGHLHHTGDYKEDFSGGFWTY